MAHARTDPIAVFERSYGAMTRVATFAGASPAEVENVVRDAAVAASAKEPDDLRRELFQQLVSRVAALERAAGRVVAVEPARDPLPAVAEVEFSAAGSPWDGFFFELPPSFDELRPGGSKAEQAHDVAENELAELPLGNRVVVVLRDVDGWTAEEVAAVLGIDVELQRVALHGGRARIRRALENVASEGTTSEGDG
jgi:RNA polymerase sigma-70 factor (ECF subfamily)